MTSQEFESIMSPIIERYLTAKTLQYATDPKEAAADICKCFATFNSAFLKENMAVGLSRPESFALLSGLYPFSKAETIRTGTLTKPETPGY